jgi:hypothetical protein
MTDLDLVRATVVHYSHEGDHHGAILLCGGEIDIWSVTTHDEVHTVIESGVEDWIPPIEFKYTFNKQKVTCRDCRKKL